MTTHSLTLRDDHLNQLRDHLLRDDGCEHAAYLLCNVASIRRDPWNREAHRNYLSARVISVPDDQVVQSTPSIVTWSTASFVRTLKEAAGSGQIVAVVHNHPAGRVNFSAQDDANEPDLVQLAVNRNGSETNLLSIILTADGHLAGRVWLRPLVDAYTPLQLIRVIGERWHLHYQGRGRGAAMPTFQRQALAFGEALNDDLRVLRIGVVGCGGTGSAVAMLLARLGVGQIVLIDNDIVDRTNLNRLHGSRQADADAMRPGADMAADHSKVGSSCPS